MTESGLLCMLMTLSCVGCHLISSPETLFGESGISDFTEKNERSNQADDSSCQFKTRSGQQERSSLSSWWEGQWQLDHKKLSVLLAKEMGSAANDPNIKAISASLSTAFSLKIRAQQATVSIDGQEQRLATTPLQKNRGVRLIGGQLELTLWCEGQDVFWRAESGNSFPITSVK